MRAIFFGMFGQFSSIPLKALIDSDVHVCAVIVPSAQIEDGDSIQLLVPRTLQPGHVALAQRHRLPTVVQLAWEYGVPTYELGNPSAPHTLLTISDLEPDIAFVACFSKILPKEMLNLPRLGCYNVHPSLLPSFRGPEPLFWTFRNGISTTGVTIHAMDHGIDSGDIVRQARLTFDDGIAGLDAERRCAELGGELIQSLVDSVKSGDLSPVPQKRGGWYYPSPQAQQFEFPASWSARRAFNFMRGTAEWRHPYRVLTRSGPIDMRSATSFEANARLSGPIDTLGDSVLVQFKPGVLEAKLC